MTDNPIIVRLTTREARLSQPASSGEKLLRVRETKDIVPEKYAWSLSEELKKINSSTRENSDIILLTGPDIDREQAEKTAGTLKGFGYPDVKTYDHDEEAASFVMRNYSPQSVVVVTTVGDDLYVTLPHFTDSPLRRLSLHNMASDPRVDALAQKIWDDIKNSGIDLKYSEESSKIRAKALEFLRTGRYEVEDEVQLSDGNNYFYFLNRTMISGTMTEETVRLQSRFADFLAENGITDRSHTNILLIGDAINNNYIISQLTPGFGQIQKMEGSLAEAFIKDLMNPFRSQLRKVVSEPEEQKDVSIPSQTEPKSQKAPESDPVSTTVVNDKSEISAPEQPRIDITANVKVVRTGLFRNKRVLQIRIDSKEISSLRWHSVLCIHDMPLIEVYERNIIKDYPRDSRLPFSLEIDLPLTFIPNARNLRIYFKPHPDEPIGINAAYSGGYKSIDI